MKINNKDLKIFVLGMVALFTIQTVYDWKQVKEDITRGWNDGSNQSIK
ncbi:hypothetical protein [Flavobacterium sp. 14A]|nr:hypothetical protein [Flavobacterium sp. 14A]NRT11359.1 hypothetical protein [Flavobacterium sp. 14A]